MVKMTQSATSDRIEREVEAMREAGRRIRASKDTARAFMVKNGFMTKGGKLAKRYGG